jgi:hypothetical protein
MRYQLIFSNCKEFYSKPDIVHTSTARCKVHNANRTPRSCTPVFLKHARSPRNAHMLLTLLFYGRLECRSIVSSVKTVPPPSPSVQSHPAPFLPILSTRRPQPPTTASLPGRHRSDVVRRRSPATEQVLDPGAEPQSVPISRGRVAVVEPIDLLRGPRLDFCLGRAGGLCGRGSGLRVLGG